MTSTVDAPPDLHIDESETCFSVAGHAGTEVQLENHPLVYPLIIKKDNGSTYGKVGIKVKGKTIMGVFADFHGS